MADVALFAVVGPGVHVAGQAGDALRLLAEGRLGIHGHRVAHLVEVRDVAGFLGRAVGVFAGGEGVSHLGDEAAEGALFVFFCHRIT